MTRRKKIIYSKNQKKKSKVKREGQRSRCNWITTFNSGNAWWHCTRECRDSPERRGGSYSRTDHAGSRAHCSSAARRSWCSAGRLKCAGWIPSPARTPPPRPRPSQIPSESSTPSGLPHSTAPRLRKPSKTPKPWSSNTEQKGWTEMKSLPWFSLFSGRVFLIFLLLLWELFLCSGFSLWWCSLLSFPSWFRFGWANYFSFSNC